MNYTGVWTDPVSNIIQISNFNVKILCLLRVWFSFAYLRQNVGNSYSQF